MNNELFYILDVSSNDKLLLLMSDQNNLYVRERNNNNMSNYKIDNNIATAAFQDIGHGIFYQKNVKGGCRLFSWKNYEITEFKQAFTNFPSIFCQAEYVQLLNISEKIDLFTYNYNGDLIKKITLPQKDKFLPEYHPKISTLYFIYPNKPEWQLIALNTDNNKSHEIFSHLPIFLYKIIGNKILFMDEKSIFYFTMRSKKKILLYKCPPTHTLMKWFSITKDGCLYFATKKIFSEDKTHYFEGVPLCGELQVEVLYDIKL